MVRLKLGRMCLQSWQVSELLTKRQGEWLNIPRNTPPSDGLQLKLKPRLATNQCRCRELAVLRGLLIARNGHAFIRYRLRKLLN